MKLEIPEIEINLLIARQLKSLFFFDNKNETDVLKIGVSNALSKCSICFLKSNNKYYQKFNQPYFNPFHSGQYSIFLYFLSNYIYACNNNTSLADRLYYLNKSLNGLDLYYEVNLPEVFFLDHPVGSVIGRGIFGNGFSFSQNCTVGNNKGVYPTLGENVKMMSGSKILGNCKIGNKVVISANTYIKDTDIPSLSLVFSANDKLIIKPISEQYFEQFIGK